MSVVEKDYLPQFAAEIVRDFECLATKPPVYGDPLPYGARLVHKTLADLIRQSVHIVLPVDGEIYRSREEAPSKEEAQSSVGVPAPLVTIEYPVTVTGKQEATVHGEVQTFGHGSKVITNPTAHLVLVIDLKQQSQIDMAGFGPGDPTPVALFYFSKFKQPYSRWPNCEWVVGQYGLNILTPPDIEYRGNKYEYKMPSNIYNIFKDDITSVAAESELPPEFKMMVRNSMSWPLSSFFQTCHSLRVGATLEARKEKSYTRSRTFEKKGVGGFEYHVLKLPTGTVKETLGSTVGSDRDGPRYHFRRAHLRTLSTGTQTFVRSCFVGNREKGVVEKDYNIPKEVK
jgi:hypothetical protein